MRSFRLAAEVGSSSFCTRTMERTDSSTSRTVTWGKKAAMTAAPSPVILIWPVGLKVQGSRFVLHQKGAVELGLQQGVPHPQCLHLPHVAVAAAVQSEVAQKAQEIRLRRRAGAAVIERHHPAEHRLAGLLVEGMPQANDGVMAEGTVEKEDVRAVEADIVEGAMGGDHAAQLLRQQRQHVPAKAVVGIGSRHGKRLVSFENLKTVLF